MDIWGAFSSRMRAARRRRIGPREAERLLTGQAAGSAHAQVRRLLDLAAAPPRPSELGGRGAAVAAFEQAGRDAGSTARSLGRRRVFAPLLARGAGWAATGAAVLLIGSTAMAASTGNLPGRAQQRAHDLLRPLGVVVPGAAGRASPSPSASPTKALGGKVGGPSGSPALLELCEAWEASKNLHKAMTKEQLRDLVAQAGSKASITGFCAWMLAGKQGRAASAAPTPTPTPSQPGNGQGNNQGNNNDDGQKQQSPSPQQQQQQ
jgi:hypothetical protein